MSTDSSAIAACKAGDLTAFDDLYRQYIGPIYGYVYRRTLNRALAEDLTSTTFLKAIERIESYDPDRGTFPAWLYAIARNVIIDHFRAEKPTTSIDDVWDLSTNEPGPSDDVVTHEQRAMIRTALKELNPQQREVVLLRLWEGLSYAEIADVLDMTEGNSKVIFHRALKSLKQTVPAETLALLLLFPHLT